MNRNTSTTCVESYSLSVAIHGIDLYRASDSQLESYNKALKPVSGILPILLNPAIATNYVGYSILPY